MAKQAEVRKPEGFDTQDLVCCVDGPKAGRWYFETYGSTSWVSQVEQAEADSTPGSTILGYSDTGTTVPHPRWPEKRGKALKWTGGAGGADARRRG